MTPPWPQERRELAAKLWKDGLSASQIAAKLDGGLTRNAVIGMVHRMGLKRGPAFHNQTYVRPWTKERDEKLAALWALGLPDHEIVAKLGGTTRASVRYRRAALQLIRKAVAPPKPIAGPIVVSLPPAPGRAWEPLPGSTPLGLMDLTARHCRWPVDLAGATEAMFCACAAERTYCAEHEDAERARSRKQNPKAQKNTKQLRRLVALAA